MRGVFPRHFPSGIPGLYIRDVLEDDPALVRNLVDLSSRVEGPLRRMYMVRFLKLLFARVLCDVDGTAFDDLRSTRDIKRLLFEYPSATRAMLDAVTAKLRRVYG